MVSRFRSTSPTPRCCRARAPALAALIALGASDALGTADEEGSATGSAAKDEQAGWVAAAIEAAADAVCDDFSEVMEAAEAYVEKAMELRATLSQRMAALPPEIFEELLHGVFRDDEWKLWLVGGVLGAAIGVAQTYLLGQ